MGKKLIEWSIAIILMIGIIGFIYIIISSNKPKEEPPKTYYRIGGRILGFLELLGDGRICFHYDKNCDQIQNNSLVDATPDYEAKNTIACWYCVPDSLLRQEMEGCKLEVYIYPYTRHREPDEVYPFETPGDTLPTWIHKSKFCNELKIRKNDLERISPYDTIRDIDAVLNKVNPFHDWLYLYKTISYEVISNEKNYNLCPFCFFYDKYYNK